MTTEDRLTAIIKHALLMHASPDINITARGIASEVLLNCEIKSVEAPKPLGRRAPAEKRQPAN